MDWSYLLIWSLVVDIWRASHRSCYLFVVDQLCYIVLGAAFYRYYELWLDLYVLWDLGIGFDDYGCAYDSLGEDLEGEM